jgi:L-aminopeptidase/D-esterase-like protein
VADVDPAGRDPFGVGAITDVAGIRVGHHQRTGSGWLTGTTAVLAPDGATAAVDVRGGGPGTRETDALDPRNLVDRVHAICLTGGSAYGLATADGVMAELERRGLGVPVGPGRHDVVPVVPTAVIFDLGRGGRFGARPDPAFGERAARAAFGRSGRSPRHGTIGAGTGARAGGLQGGIGMASATVSLGDVMVRVGALAVVNASGSLIDPTTGLPWMPMPALRRPNATERAALAAAVAPATPAAPPPLNTTIGVVAVDAVLDRAEVGRLAQSAHDGLARAIRPAHALVDGDTIFGLATGSAQLPTPTDGTIRSAGSRAIMLSTLFAAGADVFAAACVDAIITATTTSAHPAYRDLCPSAFARRRRP